jgi:uncharacterized protein
MANSLKNCNVYIDGNNHLGKAKEVQIPEVSFTQADHEALGLFGKTELLSGLDKMEATIMWNSPYPDLLKKVSSPNTALNLVIYGSLESYASTGKTGEVPFKCFMTATPKNMPGYNFKQQENVELESKFNVTAIKIVIDGEVISDVDILANICRVNGVDLLAKYRQNLGI